jgi:GT2 family glycosyltransferase
VGLHPSPPFHRVNPVVSFVLPSRNRAQVLCDVLRQLHPSRFPFLTETLVVDNASTDGTVELLTQEHPWVRLFPQSLNTGAEGRNVGLQHARGEYTFMLDDDSYPLGDSVAQGVRWFERDTEKRLGCLAYRVKLTDGSYEGAGIHTSFVGCGALFRTRCLAEIGGYPSGYLFYAEEYDVSCRLLARGLRVANPPDLEVLHLKSLINRDPRLILKQLVRNNIQVWSKFLPPGAAETQIAAELWRYRRIAEKEGVSGGYEEGLLQGRELQRHWCGDRSHELRLRATRRALGLHAVEKAVAELGRRARGRRVLLWSVGKTAHWLIAELRAAGFDPVGIVDDNPKMQGALYEGVPVFGPERFARGQYDVVQIASSSLCVNDALVQRARTLPLTVAPRRLCDYDRARARGANQSPKIESVSKICLAS